MKLTKEQARAYLKNSIIDLKQENNQLVELVQRKLFKEIGGFSWGYDNVKKTGNYDLLIYDDRIYTSDECSLEAFRIKTHISPIGVLDIEIIEDEDIEKFWEQRRFELCKDFMVAIFSRNDYNPLLAQNYFCPCSGEKIDNPYDNIAQISVQAADALIKQLRKQN